MNNFVIRTEELEDSQLKELYVETENDNDILNRLKSQSPVLLVGSRIPLWDNLSRSPLRRLDGQPPFSFGRRCAHGYNLYPALQGGGWERLCPDNGGTL